MKRKYLDRSNWSRILKYKSKTEYYEKQGEKSYIAVMYLEKVREKLIKTMNGEEVCIVDNGYIWLQYLPLGKNWSLTTMYNEKREIVQWYFDITKENGVDKDVKPFYDDLYLDVVVVPTSKVYLIDEDELEEALNKNVISKNDYELAYREARNIMDGMASNKDELINFSNRLLEYMEGNCKTFNEYKK